MDYGTKRIGLAVTDPMQIIASALETVETSSIMGYLEKYFEKEQVERLLLGMPERQDGSDTHSTPHIKKFRADFEKKFPAIPVEYRDESFTSQKAMQAMIEAGAKKKQRRTKGNLDKISATIILQEYLEETAL